MAGVSAAAAFAAAVYGGSGCSLTRKATASSTATATVTETFSQTPTATETAVYRGQRMLAVELGKAANNNLVSSMNWVNAAGVQAVSLGGDWLVLEQTPSVYNLPPLVDPLSYVDQMNTQVLLVLRPVGGWWKLVPDDLYSTDWDDPALIARFDAFLDAVLGSPYVSAQRLAGLYLGLDVDMHFGTDAADWARYTTFFQAAAAHARTVRPGLPVGVLATYDGLTGSQAPFLQALNATADVIGVADWLVDGNWYARAPGAIGGQFDAVAARYPGRLVDYVRWGYPSSPRNQSSDEQQRKFVAETFRAWDRHVSDVRVVCFSTENDLANDELNYWQEWYASSNPRCVELLRSVGLRRFPGAGDEKPAWAEMRSAAWARGW